MQTLADLEVGDPAVIAGRDGRGGEVTVVKVARVYITVQVAEWPYKRMFRIDTGREKGDGGYGASPVLLTREASDARARRSSVEKRLNEAGITIRSGFTFTVETLEAILAAIPNANPTT